MKKLRFLVFTLCVSILWSGCASMSNTSKGALIGGGSGAALGAGVGALIGKNAKSAAIGAAIGAAVGAGTGAVIGKKMDKKKAELAAAMQNASVTTVTDDNGIQGIKVTLSSGILFPTNGTTLSASSKKVLADFAATMKDMTDTDITIQGHTDNVGSYEVNEKVSLNRAKSVGTYLKSQSISSSRISELGAAYNYPVATNDTEAGRAQNRRVDIYVTANEAMIKKAEAGTL